VDDELVLVWACVVASWFVFQLPVVDVHVLVVTAKGPYFVQLFYFCLHKAAACL